MPGSARSAAITDAYRARLVALRRRIVVAVGAAWSLDPEHLDETFRTWLGRADRLITDAQAVGARLSDAYVAAFVGSELDQAVTPAGLDLARYAGVTMDGRPIREVLAPAIFTVKRELGRGAGFDQAANAGRARAIRNTTSELRASSDAALDDAIAAEPRIRGWRRVTSGRPCGACLAAATGAVQQTDEVMLVHPSCSCTKEPVVGGVRERVKRPTGSDLFDGMSKAQQDELFAGRGGEAKAELIRSGAVSLNDLATVQRQALDGRPPILTETTLADLDG